MQLLNVRSMVQKSPVIQIVSIYKVSKSVVACHPGYDVLVLLDATIFCKNFAR
jgi:hypothetical protein